MTLKTKNAIKIISNVIYGVKVSVLN